MSLQLFRYGVSNLCKGSFWGRGRNILLIISLNTLVDVIRVQKALLQVSSYKFCEHLHSDRGGISSEMITRKDLEIYYYYDDDDDEELQEFVILSGCGKELPALRWMSVDLKYDILFL